MQTIRDHSQRKIIYFIMSFMSFEEQVHKSPFKKNLFLVAQFFTVLFHMGIPCTSYRVTTINV